MSWYKGDTGQGHRPRQDMSKNILWARPKLYRKSAILAQTSNLQNRTCWTCDPWSPSFQSKASIFGQNVPDPCGFPNPHFNFGNIIGRGHDKAATQRPFSTKFKVSYLSQTLWDCNGPNTAHVHLLELDLTMCKRSHYGQEWPTGAPFKVFSWKIPIKKSGWYGVVKIITQAFPVIGINIPKRHQSELCR